MSEAAPTPAAPDLIAAMQEAHERGAAQSRADLSRWLAVMQIAVPAVYTAAAAGNVTCRNAVCEIEAALKNPTAIGGKTPKP